MKRLYSMLVIVILAACTACASPAADNAALEETTVSEIYLTANGTTWTVTLENNKSAVALVALLKKGDITIHAHDYGSFEKVGDLGTAIVRSDSQITTKPGDLILYQGNMITLYYDTNSWNFTLLGHIQGATKDGLLSVLGNGNVDLVLSQKKR
jgi:hypothetical protein